MSIAIFIRWATREIKAIWQRLEKIDVQWRLPPAPPYRTVLIDQGNTLSNGDDGCKYVAAGVDTVPSAYDPDVTSSFVDGIARGTLYVNQVAQDGYVLVVNDDRGSFRNSLRQDDVVWVGDPVSIPVDGGGSVLAYPVG